MNLCPPNLSVTAPFVFFFNEPGPEHCVVVQLHLM